MSLPEPWLRDTLQLPGIQSQLLYSFQQIREDVHKWTSDLTDGECFHKPHGLPSVAFQLRHIAGSVDRLLTYAEGSALSPAQMQFVKEEALDAVSSRAELVALLDSAIEGARPRILRFDLALLEEDRYVGRQLLRTTLGNLLIHIAEHSQRHTGQLITTCIVLKSLRAGQR